MRTVKPAMFVAIGMCLGVGATLTATRGSQATQPKPARMSSTWAPGVNGFFGRVEFIKDSKSGGCWITLDQSSNFALAPAPKEACE